MNIGYKPSFLHEFKKLPIEIQEDAKAKIALFSDVKNHKLLKVHKLKGKLKNKYSFSVTYSHRIVFMWKDKNTAIFLAVGTHDLYK